MTETIRLEGISVGTKPRPKMSPSDRAKQFLPFDAVKGLREALAKKEAELLFEERNILSEDSAEFLNEILPNLSVGDIVRVTFFENHAYRTMTGTLRKLPDALEILYLMEKEIAFADICEIVLDSE